MLLRVRRGLYAPIAALSGSVAATPFVEDTFTDTAGEDLRTQHTGEIGATWSVNTGTATAAMTFSDANRIYSNTAGTMHPSGTPADADYYVEGDLYTRSLQNNTNGFSVGLRFSTVTVSGYTFGWIGDTGGTGHGAWTIRRLDAGTVTALAAATAETLTVSTHYIMRLTVVGNILTGSINGVDVATYDITPDATKYTAAGVPAFRCTGALSNTTGLHLDYFRAYD